MKPGIILPEQRPLMPHQVEAVEYANTQTHPAILLSMRLGKSLCAVHWAREQEFQYILMIGPLQVMEGWQRELFLEGEKFVSAFDMPSSQRKELIAAAWQSKRRVWVLMNYEGLYAISDRERVFNKHKGKEETSLVLPEECYLPWDAVIADESTEFSNPNSLIGQIMRIGFRNTGHRAILTGGITTENIIQVFNQFCYLDGHFMGFTSFYKFRFALFRNYGKYSWVPKPGALKAIQEYVHKRAFVRTRKQVGLKEKKQYVKRYVNMSAKQQKLYKGVEEEFTAYLLSGGVWETEWALAQRTWLCKLAGGFDAENNLVCGAKADDIINLLRGEISGEKLIVWFRYRHELEYMRERLHKAKITFAWIMGGKLPVSERKARMDAFRSTRARVLLATEGTLKHGVDASVCDICAYYSNSDSADDRIQTEDRMVNPYTKSLDTTLLLIDYITRNTIDVDLVNSAREKLLHNKLFVMDPKRRFLQRVNQ